jgi:CRISPR-associated protein Cmr4
LVPRKSLITVTQNERRFNVANAILGLLAETPIHAGASTSNGVIDLPIQREAHTGWPCVFGSGVKGALRTRAYESAASRNWIGEVFGPESKDSDDANAHAGALAVGDARLLLLPVRSLTTHFKWVTCPALLRRALADCKRMGITSQTSLDTITTLLDTMTPGEEQAIVPRAIPQPAREQETRHESAHICNQPDKLFLEELSFTMLPGDLGTIIQFLAQFMAGGDAPRSLGKQLVIVHDDIFSHLARFATPVAAHIAIDNTRKTVKRGALWYEETLPPETVLYSCLSAQRSRKDGSTKDATRVLGHITQDLILERPYLQLGGNETVGMGWCQVKVVPGIAEISGG